MKCPIYGECLMNDESIIVDIPTSPGIEKWRKGEITFEEYFEELKKIVEENERNKINRGK